MVVILDGNSEIGTYVWSAIGNLICLRHMLMWTAVANLNFVNRSFFLPCCTALSEFPSNVSIMGNQERKGELRQF